MFTISSQRTCWVGCLDPYSLQIDDRLRVHTTSTHTHGRADSGDDPIIMWESTTTPWTSCNWLWSLWSSWWYLLRVHLLPLHASTAVVRIAIHVNIIVVVCKYVLIILLCSNNTPFKNKNSEYILYNKWYYSLILFVVSILLYNRWNNTSQIKEYSTSYSIIFFVDTIKYIIIPRSKYYCSSTSSLRVGSWPRSLVVHRRRGSSNESTYLFTFSPVDYCQTHEKETAPGGDLRWNIFVCTIIKLFSSTKYESETAKPCRKPVLQSQTKKIHRHTDRATWHPQPSRNPQRASSPINHHHQSIHGQSVKYGSSCTSYSYSWWFWSPTQTAARGLYLVECHGRKVTCRRLVVVVVVVSPASLARGFGETKEVRSREVVGRRENEWGMIYYLVQIQQLRSICTYFVIRWETLVRVLLIY